MQGYNFTERVRKVLAMSREEAWQLRHEYVGTEHLLLGLIREGEGVAAAVLQNLAVDLDEIQSVIKQIVLKGTRGGPKAMDLPYTSRAKKVLELAMAEARELGHQYVGTEHLLLGLLREEKGIAAQVLTDAGLTLDAARAEALRLLGTEPSFPVTEPIGAGFTRAGHRPVAIAVAVDWDDGRRFEQRFRHVAEAIAFLQTMLTEPPRAAGESNGGR